MSGSYMHSALVFKGGSGWQQGVCAGPSAAKASPAGSRTCQPKALCGARHINRSRAVTAVTAAAASAPYDLSACSFLLPATGRSHTSNCPTQCGPPFIPDPLCWLV